MINTGMKLTMLNALSFNRKSTRRIGALEQQLATAETQVDELKREFQAINRSMAVIEFDLDGIIVSANENFLNTLGYSEEEIVGKHHRMFVRTEEVNSTEYKKFWNRLRQGEFFSGEFPRINKRGQEIWIQATYNPVFDASGNAIRVIKFASDTTATKMKWAALDSQALAVDRCFAVIEFKLDGTILRANSNFLKVMGYKEEEIVGNHHSMFVAPDARLSDEYIHFWEQLNQGKFHSGEFHRVAKGGRDVYIQASYNPIFGINGEITSVIKYATDITRSVLNREQSNVVGQAVSTSVIEMTHTIQEISRNVNSTATIAQNAELMAEETRTSVQVLDEGSRTIRKIVEVIQDLAENTNLLALNATIESARAGDAGKGFAVVANEVKELARQTANATRNIETTVHELLDNISDVVDSTEKISKGVSNVSTNMTTIASAVEEQSVTMHSLAKTAQELRSFSE